MESRYNRNHNGNYIVRELLTEITLQHRSKCYNINHKVNNVIILIQFKA